MPRSTSSPRRIWASRPKNTAASASSSGAHPRYGARSGSLGGGQGKCPARCPGAQTVTQPLQTLGGQHHRLAAIDDDRRWWGRRREQVAALPFGGDVGVGHRLQPGHKIGLVQRLRRCGTRSGIRARIPSASTAGRSPPHSGHWPAAAPRFHRSPAGSRCAGPGPDRCHRPDPARCSIQPRLDRHRLAAIPAGMTQEHPGHEQIVHPRQASLTSSRLLKSAAVHTAVPRRRRPPRRHHSAARRALRRHSSAAMGSPGQASM